MRFVGLSEGDSKRRLLESASDIVQDIRAVVKALRPVVIEELTRDYCKKNGCTWDDEKGEMVKKKEESTDLSGVEPFDIDTIP